MPGRRNYSHRARVQLGTMSAAGVDSVPAVGTPLARRLLTALEAGRHTFAMDALKGSPEEVARATALLAVHLERLSHLDGLVRSFEAAYGSVYFSKGEAERWYAAIASVISTLNAVTDASEVIETCGNPSWLRTCLRVRIGLAATEPSYFLDEAEW